MTVGTYDKIQEQLPILLEQLKQAPAYDLVKLTKGEINRILDTKDDVPGVYLISDKNTNEYIYVGRSSKLAQRIGKDHRAIEPSQATLTRRIRDIGMPEVACMQTARLYIYNNYNVRMIEIQDVYTRVIFEVYAALALNTGKHNSFLEH